MATNKLQWKRIAKGEKLPCQSFLRKKDGEILKLSTVGGVTVGQDAYYLPVDDVIEEIRNYPIEESKDEKMRRELVERFSHIKGFDWYGLPIKDILAWLEKQGESTDIPTDAVLDSNKDGLIADTIRYKREKQGEQKHQYISRPKYIGEEELLGEQNHTDKVEPKFKVGDIIKHKERGCTCKITAIDTATAEYGVSECNGTHLPFDFQDAWEFVEQKSAEWSEDDREYMQSLLDIINGTPSLTPSEVKCHKDWLKSLKDRVLQQPKQEWSEEDNEHIKSIISTIECSKVQFPNSPAVLEAYNSDLIWLKSLRPQSHWKPSEEQMIALKCAITTADEKWVCMNTKDLESLYEDLMKLREE